MSGSVVRVLRSVCRQQIKRSLNTGKCNCFQLRQHYYPQEQPHHHHGGNRNSNQGFGRATKICFGIFAGGVATCAAIAYALDRSVVQASHNLAHPPNLPWEFDGVLSTLNHGAIRRGWTVYKMVCSTCHSLKYVAFKDFVDVCFSEQEARDIAAEYEVEDGPDESGEMFMRECKLQDKIPGPYANEEAARAANNGALPPDLSYITNARENGKNYVFHLLTAYTDPPAGIELRDGQGFNPYFENGALGMAEMLQDGLVDYDDGTPAYKSQMAKDVVEFLTWTANQDWDTRKIVFFKGIGICVIMFAGFCTMYRARKTHHKYTKLHFLSKNKNQKCP
ncbi:hypothetical protein QAD02_007011 [Eretmocerus hayati]|uniref:Uncharacterized protein n=1 Tax=Eretmocerus hayati TaxID=131215 RepID=A0ACC2N2F7_9HYME|nr:hypothetical protein QAD02_007011 [Eretmocerus hayati]